MISIPAHEDRTRYRVRRELAQRSSDEVLPAIKKWGNRGVARIVQLLSGQRFRDVSCGFRAYGREALLNLNLFGKFTYTQETILALSFKELRIAEVKRTIPWSVARGRTG